VIMIGFQRKVVVSNCDERTKKGDRYGHIENLLLYIHNP
jgi:hypothetical protein